MANEYKIQLLSGHRVADQVYHPDLLDQENCLIRISRTFPSKSTFTFPTLMMSSMSEYFQKMVDSDIFNLDKRPIHKLWVETKNQRELFCW